MSAGPREARRAARQAYRLAYWNGLVWSVGNGLASSTLVIYLAVERGAAGMAVSWILAAPQIVGLLRLATPWLLARTGDRRRFCLVNFATSSLALVALAVLAMPGVLATGESAGDWALGAIVVLWSLFHLFQYLGVVALWSWLSDLAPPRWWGRFVARREQWMLAGAIPAMLASGLFAAWFKEAFPPEVRWLGYALPAALGGLVMMAALLPLGGLPAAPSTARPTLPTALRSSARVQWLEPLRSPGFLWFLAFTLWFSFSNGMTQSAQSILPAKILKISLLVMLTLQSLLRVGQFFASPLVGVWCDRFGARAVLIVSQLVVALGVACYALAAMAPAAAAIYWIAAAHLLWVAFVGLNVGLPGMVRRLAHGENARWFAWHLAASGVAYAGGTLLGGWLVDTYARDALSVCGATLGLFPAIFLAGWLARTLGVAWLWPIVESCASRQLSPTPPPRC